MEENSSTILDSDLIMQEPSNPDDNRASQGKRFVNLLVDTMCYYILVFLVAALLGAFGIIDESSGKAVGYLLAFTCMFIYFTTMESTTGKTVGKFLTRTHVVDEEGNKIKFDKAAVRSLCRMVPLDAFSFLSSHPVGWHDSWSKTRVVNDVKNS